MCFICIGVEVWQTLYLSARPHFVVSDHEPIINSSDKLVDMMLTRDQSINSAVDLLNILLSHDQMPFIEAEVTSSIPLREVPISAVLSLTIKYVVIRVVCLLVGLCDILSRRLTNASFYGYGKQNSQ